MGNLDSVEAHLAAVGQGHRPAVSHIADDAGPDGLEPASRRGRHGLRADRADRRRDRPRDQKDKHPTHNIIEGSEWGATTAIRVSAKEIATGRKAPAPGHQERDSDRHPGKTSVQHGYGRLPM